jgi:hypothetical protein
MKTRMDKILTECADQALEAASGVAAHQAGAAKRPRGLSTGAIGIEIELTLLDPVLHVAAGAVDLFVKIRTCSPPMDFILISWRTPFGVKRSPRWRCRS